MIRYAPNPQESMTEKELNWPKSIIVNKHYSGRQVWIGDQWIPVEDLI